MAQDEGKQVLRKSSTSSAGKNSSKVKVKREACDVCGDKATGSHYRAITCEGCKVNNDIIFWLIDSFILKWVYIVGIFPSDYPEEDGVHV